MLMKGGKPLTAWDTRPGDGNGTPPSATSSSSTGEDTVDVNGNGGGGGGRDSGGGRGEGRGKGSRARQQEVVRVTAEDARAGVFTIKHVVLPLPGNFRARARVSIICFGVSCFYPRFSGVTLQSFYNSAGKVLVATSTPARPSTAMIGGWVVATNWRRCRTHTPSLDLETHSPA